MGKNDDVAPDTAVADGPVEVAEVVLSQVRESLRNLRYGHVQIIVQDGVVVQIDRLERRRISKNERHAG
jgi:hypothetical protein